MTSAFDCGCGAHCAPGAPDTAETPNGTSDDLLPRWLPSRRQVLGGGLVVAATAAATRALPLGGGSAHAATHLLGDSHTVAARRAYPAPRVVSRHAWGADERLRRPGVEFDSVVEKLVVHHTVTPTNPADPAAWVRQIYGYELATGYIDVSYHWLIDQHGAIYEGRKAREYPRGAVIDGEDARHQSVRGAATYAHNPRTIAVAMLGDFRDQLPTPAALDALVEVLAWKSTRWGLRPTSHGTYRPSPGAPHDIPNIAGHGQCSATLCPGAALLHELPTLRTRVAQRIAARGFGGYLAVSANGHVSAHGDARAASAHPAHAASRRPVGVTAAAHHPHGNGYWLATADGGVFAYGDARFYGSAYRSRLHAPITSIAATPSGNGYWLAGADGGVFAYGDARFYGSAVPKGVRAPIVALVATTRGTGYWLLAADGGVFCFGDAPFHGGLSGHRLSAPITAMAATRSGRGYWFAAADGGVFCFGDARYHGSGVRKIRGRVVSITASTGDGYVLTGANGSILSFGGAPHHGHATRSGHTAPVVALIGRVGSRDR
jgi:hypothetical protein